MINLRFSPAVAEGTGLLGSDTVLLSEQLNSSQHFKVSSSSVFSGPKRISMSKSRVSHSGTVVKG